MRAELWRPIGSAGRFELSDQGRVRQISPWRGIGVTQRIEPILSVEQLAAEQLDVAALQRQVWGAQLGAEESKVEATIDIAPPRTRTPVKVDEELAPKPAQSASKKGKR